MIDYIIVSVAITLVGLALTFFPPKKKTSKYGYRTREAMQSPESWDLAQKLAGRYFFISGLASLVICFLIYSYYPSDSTRLLAFALPIFFLAASILIVEKQLKNF